MASRRGLCDRTTSSSENIPKSAPSLREVPSKRGFQILSSKVKTKEPGLK